MSTPAELKYPKPKIILIDCPDEVASQLRSDGYNITTADLPRPYVVKPDNHFHGVIPQFNLPNYYEREIVGIDLSLIICQSPPPDIRSQLGSLAETWGIKGDEGIIDLRPLILKQIRETSECIFHSRGVFILFAAIPTNVKALYGFISQGGIIQQTNINSIVDISLFQFLKVFDGVEIESRSGDEIILKENIQPFSESLGCFLSGASFNCVFKIAPRAKSGWKVLAYDKYDAPVSLIYPPSAENGLVLVLPQVRDKAEVMQCLIKDVLPQVSPHLFPDHARMKWIHQPPYEHSEIITLKDKILTIHEEAKRQEDVIMQQIEDVRTERGWRHDLITAQDATLVAAVKKALEYIGFQRVIDVDEEIDKVGGNRREDLQIEEEDLTIIVEVKGIRNLPKDEDITQSFKHTMMRQREFPNKNYHPITIFNHQNNLPALDRNNLTPFREEILEICEPDALGVMTTWDLYRLVHGYELCCWKSEQVKPLFRKSGRIMPVPTHYIHLGTVTRIFPEACAFRVPIERHTLSINDKISFSKGISYEEYSVVSLRKDDVEVVEVKQGEEAGIKTDSFPSGLKEGIKVYYAMDQ